MSVSFLEGGGGEIVSFFCQVYVATSGKADGGQGLFARRQFLPGELVSYLSGVKTMAEEFLFDNMTLEEEEDAASYFFNLDEESPRWWGLPEGQVAEIMHLEEYSRRIQVIDIPPEMRSTTKFRTTIGHKTNCAFFEESNTEFDTVPVRNNKRNRK